jgi:hypothetical protein
MPVAIIIKKQGDPGAVAGSTIVDFISIGLADLHPLPGLHRDIYWQYYTIHKKKENKTVTRW